MPYNWTHGVPLSGLQFPLVTASGTMAVGYDTTYLSGSISQDGRNWSGLTNSISGIPGAGVYSIASLSATEMGCYCWAIKVVANSGCLPQILLGVNMSDNRHASIVASSVWGYTAGTSSRWITGGEIKSVADIVNISGQAEMITAGIAGTLIAISGMKNDVSGISAILTNVSNLYASVSSVAVGVRDIVTADAASLTSGTLAHDSRLARWFGWENWKIDKTYNPDRLYLKSDATNYSSYWELADTADDTTKTRGG